MKILPCCTFFLQEKGLETSTYTTATYHRTRYAAVKLKGAILNHSGQETVRPRCGQMCNKVETFKPQRSVQRCLSVIEMLDAYLKNKHLADVIIWRELKLAANELNNSPKLDFVQVNFADYSEALTFDITIYPHFQLVSYSDMSTRQDMKTAVSIGKLLDCNGYLP